MSDFNIEILGLKELQDKFTRLGNEVGLVTTKATETAVYYGLGKIPPYPAPRPGQKYRRTGTLGRSWTGKVYGGSRGINTTVVGIIGTNTVYAPWVVSSVKQAWMHRGRWWTLQTEFDKWKPGILKIFEDLVGKVIGR